MSDIRQSCHDIGRRLRYGLAVLVLVLAGPASLSAQEVRIPFRPPQAPPGADPTPNSFADLADRLSPLVVNISTTQVLRRANTREEQAIPNLPEDSPLQDFFNDFLNRGQREPRRVRSLGSGFVVDPAGYVVTNHHVIEDADEISVILNDGVTTLAAELVGMDEKTDLALLKVTPRTPLQSARLGDSDRARVGEWVVAIGNPFGLGGTVTAGIISARNRNIDQGDYDDFIQTDASINQGNSGGPLFNMMGEVIGVNTAIFSLTGGSVGIGFAIPSNEVRYVISQLRQGGRVSRGMIGVRIQPISEEIAAGMGLADTRGALVSGVTEGGAAARAGIQNGDVIVSFDGRAVPDDRTLPRIVAETQVGKNVAVEVIRRGQRRTFTVVVARLPEDEALADANDPAANDTGAAPASRFGMTLEALTREARERYRIGAEVSGVLVAEITPGGPASDKLRPGDVIVEVAQQRVTSAADVEAKIDAEVGAGRNAVLLLVNREGQQQYIGIRVTR